MVTGVLGRGYAQENGRNPELSARPEHRVRAHRARVRVPESRAARLCYSGSQDTAKTRPELRSKLSGYMLRSDVETMTTVT